jgi:hypothetical protein
MKKKVRKKPCFCDPPDAGCGCKDKDGIICQYKNKCTRYGDWGVCNNCENNTGKRDYYKPKIKFSEIRPYTGPNIYPNVIEPYRRKPLTPFKHPHITFG